ncbi:unnamed protein product [Anisakis simplex]|uniref:FERM domain-containing protein n=1 Tax=Anisakis simplex TaxID=6269 RepID=A0A0M3JEH7_ANISI|nr:unnamed protein product [Anisakis simplex]
MIRSPIRNLLTEIDFCIPGSNVEKAFLFDVASKIYVATDSAPVDMATYELCCDMIDVTIDISAIYGCKDDSAVNAAFDSQSQAVIHLKTDQVLFLRQVSRFLFCSLAFQLRDSFLRFSLN